MTFAHLTGGEIDAIGDLPTTARRIDTGQWVTPPDGQWGDPLAAACGWLPVTETTRPAATAASTWDATYTVVGGSVQQSWTERPKTAEELAAQAEAAEREAVRALVKAIVTDLQAEKTRAQTVIDTANATINASPAGYIKDCARAAKRIADAAIDLARYVKDI